MDLKEVKKSDQMQQQDFSALFQIGIALLLHSYAVKKRTLLVSAAHKWSPIYQKHIIDQAQLVPLPRAQKGGS